MEKVEKDRDILKIGTTTWSYNLNLDSGLMNLEDIIGEVSTQGMTVLEVEHRRFASHTDAYYERIQRLFADNGLEFIMAMDFPFLLMADEEGVEAARTRFKQQLTTARRLGAKIIRMMGGKLCSPPDETTLARWIEILKKAVEIAAAKNIKLALENHSDFYMEQLEEIVLKCGSPFFGITLDSANAFRIGEDELETVKRLAPYAFHLHLKDYVTAPEVEGGVRHVALAYTSGERLPGSMEF